MNIYEKLAKVQSELKAPKNQINSFGGYNYRSCEDILEAVKPLLLKYKLAIKISDEVAYIGERFYIRAKASVIDYESDCQEISTEALAREEESKKGMDGSQITGASSSYARKYALNGLFAIDDNKDSDTTNSGQEKTEKPQQEKAEKLITKAQINELKKLGFTDERFDKMRGYFKAKTLNEVTYKQAEQTISKQKKISQTQTEGKNE